MAIISSKNRKIDKSGRLGYEQNHWRLPIGSFVHQGLMDVID